jgi:hypothetical protein
VGEEETDIERFQRINSCQVMPNADRVPIPFFLVKSCFRKSGYLGPKGSVIEGLVRPVRLEAADCSGVSLCRYGRDVKVGHA